MPISNWQLFVVVTAIVSHSQAFCRRLPSRLNRCRAVCKPSQPQPNARTSISYKSLQHLKPALLNDACLDTCLENISCFSQQSEEHDDKNIVWHRWRRVSLQTSARRVPSKHHVAMAQTSVPTWCLCKWNQQLKPARPWLF